MTKFQTIISNLKSHNSEFSKKILDILLVKCPMSLAISTKLIDDAKGKSLKECLETEFQLSQKIVYRSDFSFLNALFFVIFLQFFISKCRTIQIFLRMYPPHLVECF